MLRPFWDVSPHTGWTSCGMYPRSCGSGMSTILFLQYYFHSILKNLGSLHSPLNISYYRGDEPVIHAMYRAGDVCPFNSGERRYQTDLFIYCGQELVRNVFPNCLIETFSLLSILLIRVHLYSLSTKTVVMATVRGVWSSTRPWPAPQTRSL